MFNVPLGNRIEFVHRFDVSLAIANVLENDQAWGHTWLIGGRPRCQLYQRDIVRGVLEAVGVGMLPDDAFTTVPFPTDWLDTSESQRLLRFQRRTLQDYIQEVRAQVGISYHIVRILRPLIRRWLLKKSPNLIQNHG